MKGVVRRQSIIFGVVRFPVGALVGTRITLVPPSLIIISCIIVAAAGRAFVGIMSELPTFATLVLAKVVALVHVMTVFAAVPASLLPSRGLFWLR